MGIDDKILREISRYNSINKYIMEQDVPPLPGEDPAALPPADPGADPAAAGAPPADPAAPAPPAPPAEPTPVDVANDPDVEEVGAKVKEKLRKLISLI